MPKKESVQAELRRRLGFELRKVVVIAEDGCRCKTTRIFDKRGRYVTSTFEIEMWGLLREMTREGRRRIRIIGKRSKVE